MVDDLNADKYLEACQHAASNPLYRWLSDAYTAPQAPKPLRVLRPTRLRAGLAFADLAAQAQQPYGLTAANAPLSAATTPSRSWWCKGRLVQARATHWAWRFWRAPGPHSAARRSGSWRRRRMRQSVSCSTAWRNGYRSCGRHGQDAELNVFKDVRLAKVCNDVDEPVPAGVEVLLADGNDVQSAGEQWLELLTEPLLIVGGTPGGLYRLLKEGPHGAGNSTGPTRILTSWWWTRRRR